MSIYIGSNEHVASSSIAFFSENAISSLCRKIGHDKLKNLVNNLEAEGQDRLQTRVRSDESYDGPEPSRERQREYVHSYFEHVNPIYPFLDQEVFEQNAFGCSEQDFSDPSQKPWSALYHTVLSLGCLYHDGGSFFPGKGLAWHYFRISFSHFTDVLICKGSILKVQALTAMAVFSLNYSSLQLETLCVSEAARAAITLGLHKKTLDPEFEMQGRSLFWVIYCIEKEYAFNSTLPSLISDCDISCPLPNPKEHFLEKFDWLQCWARFSRIITRAYDTCFSITATLNTREKYFVALDRVNHDLQAWRESIPEPLRPESPFRQHRMRSPAMKDLALRIHFAYYNLRICLSRLAIHITNEEDSKRRSEAKKYLMLAARSIVELTQFIPLEPYTPVWTSGCMPLVAMFILFDFVVKNPTHRETRCNTSYLDIVAAHFARLELASHGSIRGLTVAEFAAIARQYADSCTDNCMIENSGGEAIARPTTAARRADFESDAFQRSGFSRYASSSNATNCDIDDQDCRMDDESFSANASFDLLDFPEENNSLYMMLQHPGFDMSDIFGQGFV